MNSEPIVIRLCADIRERAWAIEYICENMRRKYGSCPPPSTTPADVCIAVEGSAIIGALGLHFGKSGVPLPIETLFQFEREAAPIPYVREQTVYYSRWNSSRQGIGLAVWLAASEYARKQGAIFTAATGKKPMLDFYRTAFGCEWFPIPGASVRIEQVGDTEREYFFADERPMPWLGILKDQISKLPPLVETMRKERTIIFGF